MLHNTTILTKSYTFYKLSKYKIPTHCSMYHRWRHELIFWGQLPQTILGAWVILLDRNNIFVFNYHFNV